MDKQYVIYARKSQEAVERQALSIDSQINELRTIAERRGIHVDEVITEAESAKEPGRPIFGALMRRVGRGEIRAIICWKMDRLSRNHFDTGAILQALADGKLQEVITSDRTYTQDGNDRFMGNFEFGMATKFIDDLRSNVKRGNRAKLALGWLPGPAPLGYLNDRATKTIVKDPERFALVRRLWDQVLNGIPVSQVLHQATQDWSLRTPRRKRTGGGLLSRSGLYRILVNPFYFGLILRNGDSYQGAHPAMISQAEFNRVQELLGRPNRQVKPRREFAYSGLVRCGECGLAVTAEEKINRYGAHYVYYHCTRRRLHNRCHQPSLRLEALEAQFLSRLDRLVLADGFEKWMLERIQQQLHNRRELWGLETSSIQRGLDQVNQRLGALTDLRLDGTITDGEFLAKRQALISEKIRMESNLVDRRANPAQAFELSAGVFFFAKHASMRFRKASVADRRAILRTVGSNLSLKDKTLLMELKKPFQLMAETASHSSWCATWDAVRTFFEQNPQGIQWPSWWSLPEHIKRLFGRK